MQSELSVSLVVWLSMLQPGFMANQLANIVLPYANIPAALCNFVFTARV